MITYQNQIEFNALKYKYEKLKTVIESVQKHNRTIDHALKMLIPKINKSASVCDFCGQLIADNDTAIKFEIDNSTLHSSCFKTIYHLDT